MKQVQITDPNGDVRHRTGPEYRKVLLRTIALIRKAGGEVPFTEDDARTKPLDVLVPLDNAWAAEHNPGYSSKLVEVP